MRTLSTGLTSTQKTLNYFPLFKVVLSRAAQSTRGYDSSRILKRTYTETDDSVTSEIILNNSDGALTSLDFEHYQAVISSGIRTGVSRSAWVAASTYALDAVVKPITANGYQYRCSVAGVAGSAEPTWPTDLGVTVADSAATWEMDGNEGDEFSYKQPLRVRTQNLMSGRGILKVAVSAVGIFNQLKEDTASTTYKADSADARTVQDWITAVAGTALPPYSGYTAYTVTYDSTDSIITSFKPGLAFEIGMNDNRFDKIQELLNYTGCKMRVQNDGNIHVFDPVISGTAYNYEYKFNVADEHDFFSKTLRLRFVEPNREVVKSYEEDRPQYSGTSTSTTSYNLTPKIHTTLLPLTSDAEASSIASAKIERYELDSEVGTVVVPVNVGQEMWDYVKVTDSRQNDTRIGNVRYLQENIEIPIGQRNAGLTWNNVISFGKITQQSLTNISRDMRDSAGKLSPDEILELFRQMADALSRLDAQQKANLWNIEKYIISVMNDGDFVNLRVRNTLIIPYQQDYEG